MGKDQFLFTVFTPTYNRAHTLPRVYSSLKRQTFSNFEWLIIDDGSTDHTTELVSSWKNEGLFEIRYYRQGNAGKHTAINRASKTGKGKFILIADSDDSFEPNTLEIFNRYWNDLSPPEQKICAGVACLAKDGYKDEIIGKIHDISTPSLVFELPYNLKYRRAFESWGMLRRDILMQYPFPEIRNIKFIPEGFVWNQICRKYPRIVTNEVLRSVYHQYDGFSVNTRYNYCRHGRGFYIYFLANLLCHYDLFIEHNPIQLIRELIQLQRVGLHSRIGIFTTWKAIKKNKIIASLFWPTIGVAYFCFLTDRLYIK